MVILQNWSLYPHWCIPMGLGHNDPWVESHMWPQQTWGQRSSSGQWPLVQVFGKKGQCIHILWLQKYVITKAGKTGGSRTALYKKINFISLPEVSCISLNKEFILIRESYLHGTRMLYCYGMITILDLTKSNYWHCLLKIIVCIPVVLSWYAIIDMCFV